MDLTSRLRSIVRPPGSPRSELTYEPDTGRYEATLDIDRVADVLGGRIVTNRFGRALVVERRYESDRWHGALEGWRLRGRGRRVRCGCSIPRLAPPDGTGSRTLFVDLETTGLSGGAGTMAFLVGCGWFDLGAFQIRQFLLTSYAAERALLSAVAECFEDAALLVTYNGKTFDVPVMETRWLFHRMEMPLESVRHFDMLHPARRLWRARDGQVDACCRLSTLEELLCRVIRVGDVPGMEIPTRYFRFLRSGDAAPLEPVLEHNRLDLVSLAAVTAYAVRLVEQGTAVCRDASETLALGRVLERAGDFPRAAACYHAAADDDCARIEVRAEALYRLGLRLRRERRYEDASSVWKRVLELKAPRFGSRAPLLPALRQFAVEQLAIHQEHRERDYEGARELTLQLLEEADDDGGGRTDATRRRLARLDRKIAVHKNSQLFA